MTYTLIPLTTFGKNPAAMYLCRILNLAKNPTLLRNAGKRITATFKQVAELEQAYSDGVLSPKTLANTLRLMREEVTNSGVDVLSKYVEPPDNIIDYSTLVDQLRRNVQIGVIKKGLRLATIARNAERIMEKPETRASKCKVNSDIIKSYYFNNQNKELKAGIVVQTDSPPFIEMLVTKFHSSDIEVDTAKLLHSRSDRRCVRLNKPHTLKDPS